MTLEEFQRRYRYNPNTDLLGKGGFSRVYKALDTHTGRTVALKMYYGDLEEKYGVLAELKKAIRLSHPNLIKYYDAMLLNVRSEFGGTANVQVGIMEYANFGDLNDFMKTFPNPKSLHLLIKGLLEGLAHLHQNGVAHRDIKPQNILIHRDSAGQYHAKIADFGLAKTLEQQGDNSSKLLGTVEYMSPEQFDPRKYGIQGKLSANTDLWAVGIILFEMFTGELPFGNRNEGFTYEQILYNTLQLPLPDTLQEVEQPYRTMIEHCLIKNANDRVASADDLLCLLEGKPIPPKPTNSRIASQPIPTQPQSTAALSAEQKKQVFWANILLSPLFGLVLYFIWRKHRPNDAKVAAEAAWWGLAVWLTLLLALVAFMIFREHGNP